MGKYTKMSQQVLEKVGGLSNITFVERCATRLRIHYASKSKVDVEAIKGIEHVVGVVDKTGQVQIIIGPEVNDAFNDFLEVSGWRPTDDRPTVVEEEPEKKGFMYWVNKFGNFSAAVFMPIVPALITGGLILAIKNLMVNYLGMGVDSGTAKVCLAIFSAGFSMLPVWIGYTMANKLKMEPIMGAFLGAVLVSSSISGVEGLDFFGIPIPAVEYTSSVMPIVMGIILMYWVDKLLKKIIPEMVRYFLKPLLTMLIVVPITLIVLGPIGTELSGVVGNALQAFFNSASIIAMPVCSAIYPYLVMLGLDKAITPHHGGRHLQHRLRPGCYADGLYLQPGSRRQRTGCCHAPQGQGPQGHDRFLRCYRTVRRYRACFLRFPDHASPCTDRHGYRCCGRRSDRRHLHAQELCAGRLPGLPVPAVLPAS